MAELKRVSFEVAKAIKKTGYQQYSSYPIYDKNGKLRLLHQADIDFGREWFSAPTYLEVWLWLWREKEINIAMSEGTCVIRQYGVLVEHFAHSDPEEAIIAAIKYLVDKYLIK